MQSLRSLPLAFGLKAPHRDDGIDFPTPRGAVLDADRSDLELVAIALQTTR